jgi:ribosomal protein S16
LLAKYGNISLVKLNKTKIKEKVMLSIKFRKEGKKHQKIMRVILVDSRKPINSGLANEILGWIDPVSKKVELKKEKILE